MSFCLKVKTMNTYKTKQVAEIIGIHPNTVRLYEKVGFIQKPERLQNGYRVFTELHLMQIRLVRLALRSEIVQNGLRKTAVKIIKETANCEFDRAIKDTEKYLQMLDREIANANDAIEAVENILSKRNISQADVVLNRKQTAEYLGVTTDTLRNWELNGLISIKRKANGYRVYSREDINRLKIIRSLRCANYSLTAILRLLGDLTKERTVDIRQSIDTPKEMEDNIAVCDRLLTSLKNARKDAEEMLAILKDIKRKF